MTVWRKGGGGTFVLIFTGIPYVISSHCEILRFGSSVRKKWKAMTCNLKLGSTFHWDLLPHRGSALSLLIWLNLASSHISHPKPPYPWFLDTRESTISPFCPHSILSPVSQPHLWPKILWNETQTYPHQPNPLLISQDLPKSTISH